MIIEIHLAQTIPHEYSGHSRMAVGFLWGTLDTTMPGAENISRDSDSNVSGSFSDFIQGTISSAADGQFPIVLNRLD